jgi:hypothetical protein
MDARRVQQIREDMERAEARRLQPHFITSFFMEAFHLLGGTIREREPKRYEITHVPSLIRTRDRAIGTREPVLQRYERITFEKDLISIPGKPLAAFVCPGHPLLDATIDLILEQHRDLLKRGTVLVDESDPSDQIRVLVYLEHSIQDARADRHGQRRVVSRQLQFVELRTEADARAAGYAPYLDYRPLKSDEQDLSGHIEEPPWTRSDLESHVLLYAAQFLVPQHLQEVRQRKEELIDKAMKAVKDRLTKEIAYWDHRAEQLKDQELAGKGNNRLNSGLARQRADALMARLQKRMDELEQERKLSPLPPVVVGAAMVIPRGLLTRLKGVSAKPDVFAKETAQVEAAAIAAVIEAERQMGFIPKDVSSEKRGYDIESAIPGTGRLRFIEVKGRIQGATTITVTKNEILSCLNKPDDFILAIVQVDGENAVTKYVRCPFHREPDFGVTSVNYEIKKLLEVEPSVK